MDFVKLKEQVDLVLDHIDAYTEKYGSSAALESIRNQMIFIGENARKKVNPVPEMGDDKKFTYAIIASRELASPDELVLKEAIDEVSSLLDAD